MDFISQSDYSNFGLIVKTSWDPESDDDDDDEDTDDDEPKHRHVCMLVNYIILVIKFSF